MVVVLLKIEILDRWHISPHKRSKRHHIYWTTDAKLTNIIHTANSHNFLAQFTTDCTSAVHGLSIVVLQRTVIA